MPGEAMEKYFFPVKKINFSRTLNHFSNRQSIIYVGLETLLPFCLFPYRNWMTHAPNL